MARAKAEIEALQALIDAMRADIDDIDTTLAAGPFLPIPGGTLTGALKVLAGGPDGMTGPKLYIEGAVGSTTWPGIELDSNDPAVTTTGPRAAAGYITSSRQGKSRWTIEMGGSDFEAGGNTGTNFGLRPFDDNGNPLPMVLAITRNGLAQLVGSWSVNGVFTLSADPVNPLEAATRRYVDAHAPRLLTASWIAGVNPNNVNLGVLAQGGTVVSVSGVSELLNGAAATVTPYWVASGGGLGANGTALTTSAFDARAAQGVVQTLPLTGSVVVPPGGRIGLRTTGVFDTSVANITVRVV